MHICFVVAHGYDLLTTGGKTYVGGAERQQVLLARTLRRRGANTSFVTTAAECEERVETELGPIHVIPPVAPSRIRGEALLRYWGAVVRAIGRANADVYYLRTASVAVLPVAAWCRANHRTCVYAAANDSDARLRARNLHMPLRGWKRLPYLAGLHMAAGALAQHESQRRDFLRLGVRAFVVPNAIDVPGESRERRAERGELVMSIGRVDGLKRPDLFVELAKRLPHRQFAWVGGGTHARMESLRTAASSAPNISWVGHVSPDEVDGYLDSASLLVNTSDTEGFPNTFLEAWSRGIPVVSLHVDPGGLMVAHSLGAPAGSIGAMAARVDELLQDPASRQSLGSRCRGYVERHHRADEVVERLLQVLGELRTERFSSRSACAF